MSGMWYPHRSDSLVVELMDSYDLDLDQRLSEETTVLVESYTVRVLPQGFNRNDAYEICP